MVSITKEELEIASKKSNEIDNSTKEKKNTIDNLKKTPIVKNTYTISETDKNKMFGSDKEIETYFKLSKDLV